jgi:hypothetical protein
MSLSHRHADLELESALLALLDSSMSTALEQTAEFPSEETATVKRLAKIGLKSESFAREALELARINEELIPRGLDLDRLERTIQNRDAIRARLIKAQLLVQRLQALSVLLGVDSYSDALDIYQALKRHGTDQALRASVKELGRIFKRGRKKEEAVPAEPVREQAAPEVPSPSHAGAVIPAKLMPHRPDGTTTGQSGAEHPQQGGNPERAAEEQVTHARWNGSSGQGIPALARASHELVVRERSQLPSPQGGKLG